MSIQKICWGMSEREDKFCRFCTEKKHKESKNSATCYYYCLKYLIIVEKQAMKRIRDNKNR